MKKYLKFLVGISLLGMVLTACSGGSSDNVGPSGGGSSSGETTDKYFNVTWVNWDNSVLQIENNIKEGMTPSYKGSTPTRSSDAQYTYTFAGWSPELAPIHADTTYTAQYSNSVNSYGVSVVTNNDSLGTVSGSGSHDFGSSVTLTATPIGDNVFKGWYSDSGFTALLSTSNPYTFTLESEGITIYAKFFTKAEEEWDIAHGVIPTLSSDGKTVTYGLYPQTNVNDSTLVSALDSLATPESNDWYLYNDEYYAKLSATPCESNYVFDNGTTIVSGTTYWFKCEPIVWNVLSNNDGEYYFLSTVLLDVHRYNEYYTGTKNGCYANNYANSEIRSWLNGDFYDSAFSLGDSYIRTTTVDNSASTTDSPSNSYACSNTEDKVFLPSYQDYNNSSYRLRKCKTTDWARARGAYYNISSSYLYNGYYWTRSPNSHTSRGAWYVTYDGYLEGYSVDLSNRDVGNTLRSVRPSLSLSIA